MTSRNQHIQEPGSLPSRRRRTFSKSLRKARPGRKSLLGVSLTGMIDVVFNLLIFFVVITTVPQREGFLAGELPSDSTVQSGTDIPALAIVIRVYAGNSFEDCQLQIGSSENSPESFEKLSAYLAAVHTDGGGLYEAQNPVVLNLGVGVSVDQMVKTYNAVVLAGFNNIQFKRSN